MSDLDPASLAEIIRRALDSRISDVQVSLPGQVQAYDSKSLTVDVLPMVTRPLPTLDGDTVFEPLPLLSGVRVSFPRSKKFSLTFPLEAGDEGMIVCSSWDLAGWLNTGLVSDPADLRNHHLQHAWFVPGVCSDPGLPSTDPGTAALVLTGPDVRLGDVSATAHAALGEGVKAWLDALLTANAAGVGGVGVAVTPPVGPYATTGAILAVQVKVK